MGPSPKLLALAVAACLLALPLGAEAPSLETQATKTEGYASLSVRVFAASRAELTGSLGQAEVFLNRRSMGYAPWSLAKIGPGDYLVSVEAPGYEAQEYALSLREKTSYDLRFYLEKSQGSLNLTLSPPSALASLDGRPLGRGRTALATGKHKIEATGFGYGSQSTWISIEKDKETALDLALERRPFGVSELRASRPAFNPENGGGFGTTVLGFTVTAPGTGRLSIASARGEVVYTKDDLVFSSWNQALSWRGRDASGRVLAPGTYTATLAALGEDGTAVLREVKLTLDSSLSLEPSSVAGARRGLRYLVDPSPSLEGLKVLALELQGGSAALQGQADLGFSAAYYQALGPWGIGASGGFSGSKVAGGLGGANAALSLTRALMARTTPFQVALHGRLAYLGALNLEASGGEADFPKALNLQVALPLGLEAGAFHVAISPGLRAGLSLDASGLVQASPLLAGGLWLGLPQLCLGVSAQALPPSFQEAFTAAPTVDLAGEVHLGALESPLGLSLALLGWDLAGASPSYGLCLGLDLSF